MRKLPQGWFECEIGDVAKVVGGGTPPSKDPTNFTTLGGIPWITPADLSGYKDVYISRGARSLSEKGYTTCSAIKIPAGSVLFSSRAPVGYVAIAATEVTTNQGFKSFALPESIDSRFVYYYLRHIKPIAEMMATGTTFKELSGSAAAKLPFVLAPLSEQKRIADKLDALLAQLDTCRKRLVRVSQIIKRFRQAVLAAATSGALTEEWRESVKELEYWQTVTLEQVAESRLGKMLDKSKNQGNPTPYLRNVNVRWFQFDLSDILEIRVSEKEAQAFSVRPGDVLVCEGGEPGRCAVWQGVEGVYVYQKALHRVRVFDVLTPEWLCYCLKSAADSGNLSSRFTGSTIKHLTGIALARFELKLPPIYEQHEIIRRVEILLAFADRLEARYNAGRERIDQLIPSLLDKAFSGELTVEWREQNPDLISGENSAEALLARIKAEKSEAVRANINNRKSVKTKTGKNMKPKMIIPVAVALKAAGTPLTAQALLTQSGYPSDATTEDLERFFLDIRDQLKLGSILRERSGDDDVFTLAN